ncbi:Bug family tripartite tricarboxylate transporter substrate binding protein [Achromobacter denitrificans]|uniref:Bug family tripartite tricarboxylate transporter substrate binding protein n=1 Tax=Achromobacter denitrificans TaxID=32002 RepID=UPI0023E8651C|nr:tripartite tricarboxylate transporter substrate binding protein [Achromobacter denitrificans]MDF3851851.1 tripartite tricarboxylate transporter substrate binding protein [Achromobacter denitrificans]
MKRRIVSALAGIALCLGAAPAARADESFPSKSVTIMVGVAPGGSLDALARLIASELGKATKTTFVVENVTGAGGLLAFQRLTRSAPDGYTLMFSNQSMVLIPLLYPKAGLDIVKDTTAVGTIANVPMVLSVSNQSGIQDLPSMLAGMRSGELKLNFGSGGPGTTAHLAEAMFLQMAGVQAELVQYRGSGPAITDLMGGTIQSVLDQTVTMLPLHRGKQIKAIAVASKERLPQMPDVPTFAEGGVPQFDLQIWNGLVAPQGTPKAVVDKLAQALTEAVQSPDFRARIDSLAARIPSAEERSPDSFSRVLARDQKQFAELARQIGLQAR